MTRRIAIIGGGSAGMITAYLLNKAGHHVTVFEKENVLGGHIRTTNKNLKIDGLNPNLHLEAGVIEFSDNFTNFSKILDELGVKRHYLELGTCTFPKDNKYVISPLIVKRNRSGLGWIMGYIKYIWLLILSLPLALKIKNKSVSDLKNRSLAEVLDSDSMGATWVKNFTMYSYSMSFNEIGQFPAEVAAPAMIDYMTAEWYRIEGGVYTYIEKILESFNGDIRCQSHIDAVTRTSQGVEISIDYKVEIFDDVVFATSPDQVLSLLSDPTPEEVKRFENWIGNNAETVIHIDLDFYDKYDLTYPSEFDFFEHDNGWGYNAFLNYLCAIDPDSPYFLGFEMDSFIDPSKILHRQQHLTPYFTIDAIATRDEIIQNNGDRHTYFAGAYLGDGLHEGAATSAVRVADLINGIK